MALIKENQAEPQLEREHDDTLRWPDVQAQSAAYAALSGLPPEVST